MKIAGIVVGGMVAVGSVAVAHADPAAEFEAQIVKYVGAGSRYSALQTRGKASPFCTPGKYDGPVQRVWEWDDKASMLSCFKPGGRPDQYGSLDSLQHASGSVIDLAKGDIKDGLAWGVERDGDKRRLWALEVADSVTLVRVPLKASATDWASVAKARAVSEGALQPEGATLDVFTKDAASAKTVDLEAAKKRVLAKVTAVAQAQSAQVRDEEDKNLETTKFPAAGLASPALVKNLTAYFKEHADKTDVDPKSVKKMKVTSKTWSVRKDKQGFTLGKTADVTVGFAKPDGRCAFVTWTMQRDYIRAGKYQPESAAYPNGFQSGWTHVKCERIK